MSRYLTFYFVFIPYLLLSQTNFKQGYIITDKGDTVKGFINFKSWNTNPETISFKQSLSAEKREIGINDVSYFNIEGFTSYRRFNVGISLDQVNIEKLGDSIDTSKKDQTVFLKIEQEGDIVTLFSYSDFTKTRFYILEKNEQKPIELFYKLFYSDGNKITPVKGYTNQLAQIAETYQKSSTKLTEIIKTSKYNLDDFKKICTSINNNILLSSVKEVETGKRYKSKRFFLSVRDNMTSNSYAGDGKFTSGTGTKANHSPELSFGMDIYEKPLIRRLIYRIEIIAGYRKSEMNDKQLYSSHNNELTHSFNMLKVGLSPQVIYNVYNQPGIQWYIGIGVSGNMSFVSDNILNTKTSFNSNGEEINHSEAEDAVLFEKLWFSFPVKTGISFRRKFDAFLVYNPKASMTNYVNYSIVNKGISIGLAYNFAQKTR